VLNRCKNCADIGPTGAPEAVSFFIKIDIEGVKKEGVSGQTFHTGKNTRLRSGKPASACVSDSIQENEPRRLPARVVSQTRHLKEQVGIFTWTFSASLPSVGAEPPKEYEIGAGSGRGGRTTLP